MSSFSFNWFHFFYLSDNEFYLDFLDIWFSFVDLGHYGKIYQEDTDSQENVL